MCRSPGLQRTPSLNGSSALYVKDVTNLEVDTFFGRQGLKAGGAAAIVLENVVDGVLRNLRAAEGSGTFLEFRGRGTRDLRIYGAELHKARRPASFTDGARRTLVEMR